MTRLVSDAFREPPAGMTAIPHVAVIEMEAAILGAEIIAFLMQPESEAHFDQFIELLCGYFHGKGGESPTKGDLQEAARIKKACDEWRARTAEGKHLKKNSILIAILDAYRRAREIVLTGDPDSDWRALRSALEASTCPRLQNAAREVRNIRLLERGTELRQQLSQDWRDTGAYTNALATTRQAFVREHFSTNAKPEGGVVVMNMHKAKGKQFDEVIIFEGWPIIAKGKIVANLDRIVRRNERSQIDDQSLQNFRVSVTRGKVFC
jgi:DNA helicase-2/ATP-dependent DNA helicase PcrA